VALLAVHVVSAVLDDYVRITVTDAFVPFVSAYRPIWLGLGSLASDLLLALTATSLVRRRVGYGAWRAVHWTSYACWPLAVVHGLGTGTDTRQGWNVGVTLGCVALVHLAMAWRVVEGWPRRATVRVGAVLVTACAIAVVVTWAKQGPFAPNWSKRANAPPPVVGAR
jgi:DMSO/TMAO reductase YedYZ heme-binding membrane subunit